MFIFCFMFIISALQIQNLKSAKQLITVSLKWLQSHVRWHTIVHIVSADYYSSGTKASLSCAEAWVKCVCVCLILSGESWTFLWFLWPVHNVLLQRDRQRERDIERERDYFIFSVWGQWKECQLSAHRSRILKFFSHVWTCRVP